MDRQVKYNFPPHLTYRLGGGAVRLLVNTLWTQVRVPAHMATKTEESSSSIRRDLAWEPEGCHFKSSTDHSVERGLVPGEVPVHLLALLPSCP